MENNIKYKILKTAELTSEEKRVLVYEFWKSDLEYSLFLKEKQDAVLREIYSYDTLGEFDKKYMYSYKHADYSYIIGDRDITDYIWEDVRFLCFMESLRPMLSEEEINKCKKVKRLKK